MISISYVERSVSPASAPKREAETSTSTPSQAAASQEAGVPSPSEDGPQPELPVHSRKLGTIPVSLSRKRVPAAPIIAGTSHAASQELHSQSSQSLAVGRVSADQLPYLASQSQSSQQPPQQQQPQAHQARNFVAASHRDRLLSQQVSSLVSLMQETVARQAAGATLAPCVYEHLGQLFASHVAKVCEERKRVFSCQGTQTPDEGCKRPRVDEEGDDEEEEEGMDVDGQEQQPLHKESRDAATMTEGGSVRESGTQTEEPESDGETTVGGDDDEEEEEVETGSSSEEEEEQEEEEEHERSGQDSGNCSSSSSLERTTTTGTAGAREEEEEGREERRRRLRLLHVFPDPEDLAAAARRLLQRQLTADLSWIPGEGPSSSSSQTQDAGVPDSHESESESEEDEYERLMRQPVRRRLAPPPAMREDSRSSDEDREAIEWF